MTDPWAPPGATARPWAPPPTPAPPSAQWGQSPTPPTRTWGWLTNDVLAVGISGLLVLGASSSYALTHEDVSAEVAAAQLVLDARLPALMDFVERERGLEFTKPVEARVLDDEQFVQELNSGGTDEDDDAPEGDSGATLQALGLLAEGDDLDEVVGEALDSGVVGFYDNETGELVVRGRRIDPYVELVIVHELVHAVQDQAFDLDRPDLQDADDERFTGFQSLVEGDATRVEEAFRAAQTPEVREQIEAEEQRRFGGGSDREPGVVDVLLGFPYFAGEGYVEDLLEAGGQARLDQAFATPPTTTEQIVEPLSDDLEPVVVPTPTGPGKKIDEGVIGAAGLALLIPGDPTGPGPHLGWDGDRYATFTDDGRTCTVADVVMEGSAERDRLVAALRGWADRNDGEATATGDEGLRLRSCTG